MENFNRFSKKQQPAGYGLLALMLTLICAITFSQNTERTSAMTGAALAPSERANAATETANEAEIKGNAASAEASGSEEVSASEIAEGYMKPEKMPIRSAEEIDTETLWLARGIYSETKKPREQELVAWVIRNRVETNYRGNRTYREAVLDPYQFSAFNPGSSKRYHYMKLDPHDNARGWSRALAIAAEVRQADSTLRPFPKSTRHFFSERSMAGGRHPSWSYGEQPVTPDRPYEIEKDRFRFYKGVS